MNDYGLTTFLEIETRLKDQGFEIEGKAILFIGNYVYLDGYIVDGDIAISKDEEWVCLPMHDEEQEAFIGEYIYKPKCFQIDSHLSTYISNGSMTCLTQIYILNR